MSARAPRRSFARPFVVTVAAALPAAGCYVDSRPAAQRPVVTETSNPPRPQQPSEPQQPAQPTQKAEPGRQWTVAKQSGTCTAMDIVKCPQGAMCNPPPPAAYACPPELTDGGRATLTQTADGSCDMTVAMSCPPNVMCNPPPPTKVACPQ